MPHKSAKEEETASWFEKAAADLESAKILFRANKSTQWHQVLFFCQQAVEKSMKGFLVSHTLKFLWTHDLIEIGKRCSQVDETLKEEIQKVTYLSNYAWEFRYPGEDPEPTKNEAKAGILNAESFIRFLISKMPSSVAFEHLFKTSPKKKK